LTLILFIPYQQGCILLSDKQRTLLPSNLKNWDGHKDEFTKLFFDNKMGFALGCAGNLDIAEVFFSNLMTYDSSKYGDCLDFITSSLNGACDEQIKNLKYSSIYPAYADLS
jgi:hypothetical protein